MSRESQWPLVTVSCIRDLSLLDLQAQSLDRYLEDNASIILIVNELDPEKWQTQFDKKIKDLYKRHRLQIYYVNDFDADLSVDFGNEAVNGWLRQQVLKILISKKIATDAYFVLDSQNFLVKKWSFKSKLKDKKLPYQSSSLTWARESYENYCGILGISAEIPDRTMSLSTPMFFNTDLIKKLIDLKKDSRNFTKWFFEFSSSKSEFALYYAWLKFNGGLENYYYESHTWCHPMLRDSSDFKNDVNYFLENLGNFELHRWASINHRAWLEMTVDQYDSIVKKLRGYNLNPDMRRFRDLYNS
jgi:hypothetical protein